MSQLNDRLVVVVDFEDMDVVRPLLSSGKARRSRCYTHLDTRPNMDIRGVKVPLLCYGEHFFLVGKFFQPAAFNQMAAAFRRWQLLLRDGSCFQEMAAISEAYRFF